MKKTKKLKMVLIGLTCLMTAGMQMDVFAGETVPTVKTVHKHFVMAEGIAAPEVTFYFTAEKVTADAPKATIGTLTYSNTDTAEEVENGLSSFNKEIISNGYLTELGIHHKNEFNEFNLSCDLMEPFRVIVDNFVYFNQERELNTNYKLDIVNILNNTYKYQNKSYTLKDIIGLFVKNTLNNIDNTDEYKDFIYYEG